MLFEHITSWAVSAAAAPTCRTAMEQLFAVLLASMNRDLSSKMFGWLDTEPIFVSGDLKGMSERAFQLSLAGR